MKYLLEFSSYNSYEQIDKAEYDRMEVGEMNQNVFNKLNLTLSLDAIYTGDYLSLKTDEGELNIYSCNDDNYTIEARHGVLYIPNKYYKCNSLSSVIKCVQSENLQEYINYNMEEDIAGQIESENTLYGTILDGDISWEIDFEDEDDKIKNSMDDHDYEQFAHYVREGNNRGQAFISVYTTKEDRDHENEEDVEDFEDDGDGSYEDESVWWVLRINDKNNEEENEIPD